MLNGAFSGIILLLYGFVLATIYGLGMWLSLVERCVRDAKVAGSNPVIPTKAWGYSSDGRALEWHSRGQRFDPAYLHHQKNLENIGFQGFFLFPPQYATSKAYKRQPELQFAKKFLYSRNARPIKGNGCSGKFYLNKKFTICIFFIRKIWYYIS